MEEIMKVVSRISLISIIVALSSFLCFQKNCGGKDPMIAGKKIAVVETKYGKVRGYIHSGIYVYKGIPYAKAERFMPPMEPDPWEDVRSSMHWGPVCPTMDPPKIGDDETEFLFQHDWGVPDEDCLRLNIWTPGINDGGNRPVMVWIHGGGFSYGSSQELPCYDGENLSRKGNIVLVSLNHRLNVIGFLDLSEFGERYKFSANVGLLDIVEALKWIKENISNFGGDPDNVTLFGQSGGGGKIIALMSSPYAKGLFHKAIIQSAWSPKFIKRKISGRIGKAVVEELGLNLSQIDSIQKIPYPELADAAKQALKNVVKQLQSEGYKLQRDGVTFGPTLDGDFLPYEQSDPRAFEISKDIPIIIGTVKNEFPPSLWGKKPLRDAPLDSILASIKRWYGEKADEYIAAVKKAFPNDTRPTDLIDVDTYFRRTAVTYANLKSTYGSAKVYMYLFTWQSPIFDGDYKAIHCMELPFVFNNISLWGEMTGGGKKAYALADKMSSAWIHFAKHGDPNHRGLPRWEPYTQENGATMFFDNKCCMRYHHDKELLEIIAEMENK